MSETPGSIWQIGEWHVNPALGEISRDGRTSKLDPRAMRLLMFLAQRPGEIVSVDALLDAVWGPAVVTAHSAYEAIAALRHALEDRADRPAYILTLPRRGYRLVAPVVRCASVLSPSVLESSKDAHIETPAAGDVRDARLARRRRVAGLALVLLTLVGTSLVTLWKAYLKPPADTAVSSEKSIAVLPFIDMSERHDQEYFAEGMAEDVLDSLVKVPGLRVIARTSSFQFRGRGEEDLGLIRTKLGVGFVVVGSVRRSGDDIRVTAQLLSVADGSHLWSESYDRKVVDALQVQSQIAYGIARALDITITDVDTTTPTRLQSADAYHVYLKGRHAVDRYDRVGFEEGSADFQQALRLDPTFAPAILWLAWALTEQAELGYTAAASIENGRATAQQAVRLNPKLAMAHSILASIHLTYDWDWAAADRELNLALALEPHNVWPLLVASQRAAVFGRWDEAVHYNKEAIALSPLEPVTWESLGFHLLWSGRFDEAEAAIHKALEMRPTIEDAHSMLGVIYLLRGQLEAARDEFEREKNVADDGPNFGGLACVYHALGRDAESDRMLARVAERGEGVAFYLAEIHAFRGELDAAFDSLERAYRHRDFNLIYIRNDPLLRSLEHDRRWDELLRNLALNDSTLDRTAAQARGYRLTGVAQP